MTASLFGDAADVPAAALQKASPAARCSGAWESFRRVPRDIEQASQCTPNRKGQYPYEIYHSSLADMSQGRRNLLVEIVATWPAADILEFTNALERWKRLDPWERQNFQNAIGY